MRVSRCVKSVFLVAFALFVVGQLVLVSNFFSLASLNSWQPSDNTDSRVTLPGVSELHVRGRTTAGGASSLVRSEASSATPAQLAAKLVRCVGAGYFVYIGSDTGDDHTIEASARTKQCAMNTAGGVANEGRESAAASVNATSTTFVGVWWSRWGSLRSRGDMASRLSACGLVVHEHDHERGSTPKWAVVTTTSKTTEDPSVHATARDGSIIRSGGRARLVLLFLIRRPEYVWLQSPFNVLTALSCRGVVLPSSNDAGSLVAGWFVNAARAVDGVLLLPPSVDAPSCRCVMVRKTNACDGQVVSPVRDKLPVICFSCVLITQYSHLLCVIHRAHWSYPSIVQHLLSDIVTDSTSALNRHSLLRPPAVVAMPEPEWSNIEVGTFLPCTADAVRRAKAGGQFSTHVMNVLHAAKEAFSAVGLRW